MPDASASRLALPAALLLLAVGMASMGLYTAHDLFDADELQHAHLAWLVAGGKVIYRDFWDNHGPLYALANGGLLSLSGAAPQMSLLYACRVGALAAAGGILALTFGIARRVGLTPATAIAAAAIAASLVFVQDRAAECRPDGWQNLFWFAGLFVLLGRARSPARLAGAGALLGLAVLTNVKAGLGPFVVALWYVAGARLHGLAARDVARELGGLAAGALVVYAAVLAYFARHGAVAAFHEYSTTWNFMALDNESVAGLSGANQRFLATRQLPFVALAAVGALAWIAELRAANGRIDRRGGSLLLAVAAGTGLSLGLDLYNQFFLLFLPLWSIVAAFGLLRCGEWLVARAGAAGRAATGVLVGAAAAAMLWTSLRLVPLEDRPMLAFQESFTRMLLVATPRSEPVGVIWDVCGGFMFNEPLQFYWGAEAAIGATAARHGGRNPFAEDFVAALERGRVRYVVGREDGLLTTLPAVTQRYLRERYTYANCLWKRRREPVAGDPS